MRLPILLLSSNCEIRYSQGRNILSPEEWFRRGRDREGVNYMSELSYEGQTLLGETFDSVDFAGISFEEAELRNCRFVRCSFRDARM